MLYPKEDKITTKLMFACRTCQYSEEAQSSCVFRNNMYNTVGETAGVTQDVGSDPTVGDPEFSSSSSSAASSSSFIPDQLASSSIALVAANACCVVCGARIEEEGDEDDWMVGEERGLETEVESGDDEAYLSETKYGRDGEMHGKEIRMVTELATGEGRMHGITLGGNESDGGR